VLKKFSFFLMASALYHVSEVLAVVCYRDKVGLEVLCPNKKLLHHSDLLVLRDSRYRNVKVLDLSGAMFHPLILSFIPEHIEGLLSNYVKNYDGSSMPLDRFIRVILNLKGLKKLSIQDNAINSFYVRELAGMQGLLSLDISGNSIGYEGAKYLSEIQGVRTLKLSRAKLSDEGVSFISKMNSVTSLDLSFNFIDDIGAFKLAEMHRLKELDLSNNQIGNYGARYIARMQGLTALDLSKNQICNEGAECLSKMKGLEKLNLADNPIFDSSVSKASVPLYSLVQASLYYEIFQFLTQIEVGRLVLLGRNSDKFIKGALLFFSNNDEVLTLNRKYLDNKKFSGFFSRSFYKNLKKLVIKNSVINPIMFTYLPETLTDLSLISLGSSYVEDLAVVDVINFIKNLKNLKKLAINYFTICEVSAEVIGSIQGLEILDLNSTLSSHVRMIAQIEGIHSFYQSCAKLNPDDARCISQMQGVKILDISANPIEDSGVEYIAEMSGIIDLNLSLSLLGPDGAESIANMRGITNLNLSHNEIYDEGAISIAKMQGILRLNLEDIEMGVEGALSIAFMEGITDLNLSCNQLYDEGASIIAQMRGIKILNLSDNKIRNAGAESLSAMEDITHLNLSNNQIGNEGVESIARMEGLNHLDLSENRIDDGAVSSILTMAGIEKIDFSYNQISTDGVQRIQAESEMRCLTDSQGESRVKKNQNITKKKMQELLENDRSWLLRGYEYL
jgi:Leucine-rich repeat (LRR) protein